MRLSFVTLTEMAWHFITSVIQIQKCKTNDTPISFSCICMYVFSAKKRLTCYLAGKILHSKWQTAMKFTVYIHIPKGIKHDGPSTTMRLNWSKDVTLFLCQTSSIIQSNYFNDIIHWFTQYIMTGWWTLMTPIYDITMGLKGVFTNKFVWHH